MRKDAIFQTRSSEDSMAEKLKDHYMTRESIRRFAGVIAEHDGDFDQKRFVSLVFDGGAEEMELMARMRHATTCLKETLPKSYTKAIAILRKAAPTVKGWEAMCLPDYAAMYGLDQQKTSLKALETFTRYSTSEFGVRPFLIRDAEPVMEWMTQLAGSRNHHLRRFASEGCRPRLPWAMAIPEFKSDPGLIFPILERLKSDPSEYVRKSVANNLNDISKDHPGLVLKLCKKWQGASAETDWIIKHGCRTLLKAGDREAMRLFGFADPKRVDVTRMRLSPRSAAIGDAVSFHCSMQVGGRKPQLIRLEYAVYYQKKTKKITKKVFKISEKIYKPGEYEIRRNQSFADMSTRKHAPGKHDIAVIINGVEKARATLLLR
jgi:3-methyladenine DNA glycosylase AlkC